jgi:LmeA-like phospholipid-binding
MRRLVIGVLVLVGLLVAADFGAAALAESAVSRQMRAELGLADDPSVRINGFPFLTQAVSGQYPSIDVDAQHLAVGPFQQVEVNAQLHDVTAPLSMLLSSGKKTVQVAGADGSVRIGPTDIQRLVPGLTKGRIEPVDAAALRRVVEQGGNADVANLDPKRVARLVGTLGVLGKPVELAVLVTLNLKGSVASLGARDIRLSDGTELPLSGAVQRSLLGLFDRPLDTGSLPLKVTPTTFTVENGMLAIGGKAGALTLGG